MKKSRACPGNKFFSDHSRCALGNETFFQHITQHLNVHETEIQKQNLFIKNNQQIPQRMRNCLNTPRKEHP